MGSFVSCNLSFIFELPLLLLRRIVLDATLCDKVCQWLVAGRWFSPCTQVSSTNKADRHNIAEILLNVVLNTINITLTQSYWLIIAKSPASSISAIFRTRTSSTIYENYIETSERWGQPLDNNFWLPLDWRSIKSWVGTTNLVFCNSYNVPTP